MNTGDRVTHAITGWTGIVEAVDIDKAPSGDRVIDVHWLLDDGVTLGCCSSMCWESQLATIP